MTDQSCTMPPKFSATPQTQHHDFHWKSTEDFVDLHLQIEEDMRREQEEEDAAKRGGRGQCFSCTPS